MKRLIALSIAFALSAVPAMAQFYIPGGSAGGGSGAAFNIGGTGADGAVTVGNDNSVGNTESWSATTWTQSAGATWYASPAAYVGAQTSITVNGTINANVYTTADGGAGGNGTSIPGTRGAGLAGGAGGMSANEGGAGGSHGGTGGGARATAINYGLSWAKIGASAGGGGASDGVAGHIGGKGGGPGSLVTFISGGTIYLANTCQIQANGNAGGSASGGGGGGGAGSGGTLGFFAANSITIQSGIGATQITIAGNIGGNGAGNGDAGSGSAGGIAIAYAPVINNFSSSTIYAVGASGGTPAGSGAAGGTGGNGRVLAITGNPSGVTIGELYNRFDKVRSAIASTTGDVHWNQSELCAVLADSPYEYLCFMNGGSPHNLVQMLCRDLDMWSDKLRACA